MSAIYCFSSYWLVVGERLKQKTLRLHVLNWIACFLVQIARTTKELNIENVVRPARGKRSNVVSMKLLNLATADRTLAALLG
jgi:hypothetical protein